MGTQAPPCQPCLLPCLPGRTCPSPHHLKNSKFLPPREQSQGPAPGSQVRSWGPASKGQGQSQHSSVPNSFSFLSTMSYAWGEVLQHLRGPVGVRQGGRWLAEEREARVLGQGSPAGVHSGECEGHALEKQDHEEPLAGGTVAHTLAILAGLEWGTWDCQGRGHTEDPCGLLLPRGQSKAPSGTWLLYSCSIG